MVLHRSTLPECHYDVMHSRLDLGFGLCLGFGMFVFFNVCLNWGQVVLLIPVADFLCIFTWLL